MAFVVYVGIQDPRTLDKDVLGLLRDPVDEAVKGRLITAARGIEKVLVVTVAFGPVKLVDRLQILSV